MKAIKKPAQMKAVRVASTRLICHYLLFGGYSFSRFFNFSWHPYPSAGSFPYRYHDMTGISIPGIAPGYFGLTIG